MARSIAEIKTAIETAVAADITLGPLLTSSSAVAEFALWIEEMAVSEWTLENLYDLHKAEVNNIIALQKPHTLQWYATMAKAFQYGPSLPPDSDVYAMVPPSDPAMLVVKYAAAVEFINELRIKVAKLSVGGTLAPITTELSAFGTYMNRIKDAGVRLRITSDPADVLTLDTEIFYDPLVLDDLGHRLDGTNDHPVSDAINLFLTQLPFNGLFILNRLTDAIQAVEGVMICHFANAVGTSSAGIVPITVEYPPDAGYIVNDETYFNAHVSYTPHAAI